MTDILVVQDLYTKTPVTAIPGARIITSVQELTAAQQVITNYFGIGVLPAGHKLVSAVIECDDMDSAVLHTLSVGILNTYYGQAPATAAVPAAYAPATGDSYSATNTGTAPALVSGQNIFTSSTVPQAGGRVYPSLAFTDAIGVDYNRDRIIACYFPTVGTAVTGTLTLIYGIDAA